ncbi:MAG: O-methyltransferase [Candidatus Cloacimonadota bacterium]|nr:MAG: O-methyltransferase [Candidatus Cloacimonadota bacterium]
MFHNIPVDVKERMKYLEEIDSKDRRDETPGLRRLRQIPPETGKFISLLAASAPPGLYIEIGASAGYSALWLSLACMQTERKLVTFELQDDKIEMARETISRAKIGKIVELVEGNALDLLQKYNNISFCFLDAEKEIYLDCYQIVVPKMVEGGILVADNVISHREVLEPFINHVMEDPRVDSLIVPIGKGELVCRKL